MPDTSRAQTPFGTAVLVAVTAIAPVSIDMFLPSMPDMAREFDTSTGSISLAVTLFLFAFAGSQLVFGPASDRWGRRPVMVVGLALYIAASIASLLAESVAVLLASRVVQGFGAGAGPAIGRAIVIDVYPRERAARIMAVITVSTALAPMLSPMAGGVLQDLWGWRSVFVVQTLWGAILAAGYFTIFPETVPAKDASATRPRRMIGNYRTLYGSRVFVTSSLLMGLLFSGHLVFISTSSFVLVDQMGLSASVFGFAFGSVAVGIMAGATLSGRLVGTWDMRRIIVTGTAVGAASSVAMALAAQTGHSQPLLVVLPMCLTAACQGFVRPPAMSSALVPFPMMAGLASAVMGFSQIALASTFSIVFTSLFEPGSGTMTAAIAVASLSGLGLVLATRPAERPVSPG